MRTPGKSRLFAAPYGAKALVFAHSLPQNTHLRKKPRTQADFDAIERAKAKRERRSEKLAAAARANGLNGNVRHS